MSLDWDATKTDRKQWDALDEAIRTEIIFACIATGMGEITEKNWKKWWARASIMDGVYRVPDENVIQPAHVKAAIGLTTNVFPEESDAQWCQRFTRMVQDRIWRLERQEEAEADGAE